MHDNFLESTDNYYVIKNTGHWTPTTDINAIPVMTIQSPQLRPETRMLINRFLKEFDHYFGEPDSDQIKMMMLHPVMVWGGIEYVFITIL